METEPNPTASAIGTAPPVNEAPGGYFQAYIAQIQAAMQQHVENGASPHELGERIFGSILKELQPGAACLRLVDTSELFQRRADRT